jgi:hypothetical protein
MSILTMQIAVLVIAAVLVSVAIVGLKREKTRQVQVITNKTTV